MIAGFFCYFKTIVFNQKTIDKYYFLLYNVDNTRSVFFRKVRGMIMKNKKLQEELNVLGQQALNIEKWRNIFILGE